MQVLNDIWSSVRGSTNTRVKDPIIGTFIVSWCVCNWDKLAILFWGSKIAEQRINDLTDRMSVISYPSLLIKDLDLLLFPVILTLIYLFILPSFSLWVKKKQDNTTLLQHSHAIDLDIRRAEKQKDLNKAILRASPEKEFLAQEVKLDLQSKKEKIERRNKIKEYIDKKVEAASSDSEYKSAKAQKERLELENKKRKEEFEKRKFEEQTSIHKSTMASLRFPAIYQMMNALSESLRKDGVIFSFEGLANTVSALFGYDSAKEMLDDEDFSSEKLTEIRYVYHDPSYLSKRLEDIVTNEDSENKDLSEGLLFDHLTSILEPLSLELLSPEFIAERISEDVNEYGYDLLASDELSGPIAETDTVFEYIELNVDDFHFDQYFEVRLSGYASGHHRKESDMPSQDLTVYVTAKCEPLIGKYGLSPEELEISGSPRDYGSD